MDHASERGTEESVANRSGARRLWILVLFGLLVWQGWMTLTLFGCENPWQRLLDDQPIVSGRHPLHLYHAYLGAQALWQRGTLCRYDPAFYAGYPKTPVFDSGSRPAELCLAVAGGSYRPEAYKVGLGVCCLAVPLLLFAAARGVGLGRGASCLAVVLGLLTWWANPCRDLLEAGDVDLLLAGLAALTQVGFLVRFDRKPGLGSWLMVLASGAWACFAQPAFLAVLLPLILVYYISAGARHGLVWHLAFQGVLAGGVAVNAFWLFDWLAYWWIRAPLQAEAPLLPHRTFHLLWSAPMWGGPADRVLAGVVLAAAIPGVWIFNAARQRPAARLLGLGALGFLSLAVAGLAWEPLASLGTPRLFVPALWFASLPAAHGLAQLARLAFWHGVVLMAGMLATLALGAGETVRVLAIRCLGATPLAIGLETQDKALIDAISEHTTREARILWEDCCVSPRASHWSALLPILTQRAYLGGLDANACIEHAYPALVEQNLAGRPVASWRDDELSEFCRHYNAGWAVLRSPAAIGRFQAWLGTDPLVTISGSPPVCLYQLPCRSFVLKGQARLLEADGQHLALADVIPEDGKVVLSMHYQAGLQVSPNRVQIEREPDACDPIPFIRLRMPGPVSRLTLTW